jgi:hypothetical protein
MRERAEAVIRIAPLKKITLKLDKHHPLRSVMAVENDEIRVDEFLSKLGTWLRLLDSTWE